MKVTNTGDGKIGFKDDEGKLHFLEAGESVECNYKKPTDGRLVIENEKKKKNKEVD